MALHIQILAVSEMAVPPSAVYCNVGAHGEMLGTIQDLTEIPWSDGTVSTGVKHCGCAFYIEDDGHKVLVDTGVGDFDRIHRIRSARGDRYYLKALTPITQQLEALGVRPEQVDLVVNTHLHWDHIGGNLLFPNAELILPAKDLPYFLAAPAWAPHFFPGLSDCVTGMRRVRPVDGEGQITPHLRFLTLGGHTPGSLAVLAEAGSHTIALPGDIVPKYENWENHWPGPGGNVWNLGELAAAYDTLRSRADIVVPAHDWKVFTKYPDGRVL